MFFGGVRTATLRELAAEMGDVYGEAGQQVLEQAADVADFIERRVRLGRRAQGRGVKRVRVGQAVERGEHAGVDFLAQRFVFGRPDMGLEVAPGRGSRN